MNNSPQTIRQATTGIILLVLISKAIGFVREMVVAYRFGTSAEYDVYLIAISIPMALFILVSGLSNLFIPEYSRAKSSDQKIALWSNFNLLALLSIVLTIVYLVFTSHIIRFIAPGMAQSYYTEAILISRLSSVIIVISLLETFFRSALNCEKSFFIPASGPIASNFVYIILVVLLSGAISTYALLWGLVCGYLAQTIFVFSGFYAKSIKKYYNFSFWQEKSGKFLSLAGVIIVIEASSQLYVIIDRYFASSMGEGIISALGYTYILFLLPISVFAYALSTAIFPYLTDAFTKKNAPLSGLLLSRGISITLLLALPISVVFWVFSREIVVLVFQRGAFGIESVQTTSQLLKYFSLGMAGQALVWLLYRAYYAAKRTDILVINILMAITVKIAASILLIKFVNEIGLVIASSISYSLAALFLIIAIKRTIAPIDPTAILFYVIKLLCASAIMLGTAHLMHHWYLAELGNTIKLYVGLPIVLILALLVFIIAGYMLNVAEIRQVVEKLRKGVSRK